MSVFRPWKPSPGQQLFSYKEASIYINKTEEQLRDLIRAGFISPPTHNLSKRIFRFHRSVLDEFLAGDPGILRYSDEGFVYFIGYARFVKIGFSRNLMGRFRDIQMTCPEDLCIFGVMRGKPAKEAELHRTFKKYRLRGEWFEFSEEIKGWVEKNTQKFGSVYIL